ncbi:uncharacterized protein LOC131303820 [Rhododendron vialii]|uniref:uncharacterized protein LOC131303820 n=1 Tax=Rhododendron vialii TaxID=182163 RepID=UPI00265E74B3|nr:uncharacterized protein LOC131303820 [Rhododendron vialii]
MADDLHNHHHHHRPHRLSLPHRPTATATTTTPKPYSLYPYLPSTPTPTPTPTSSKHPLSLLPKPPHPTTKTTSLSFLFLLLFSLRSLYSLLPFLRSSPSSFSLFPFSFLVSLLSLLLTLSFSLLTPPTSKSPFRQNQHQPIFSPTSISQTQFRILLSKSLLLAVVFLLRFQALRYCGTAAMILAELSGNVAARFFSEGRKNRDPDHIGSAKVRGFFALFVGLLLLSISWDRIECFPLSAVNVAKQGFQVVQGQNCVRVWPMLLPFFCGFLGCYERVSMNWGSVRELGRKRVRLISLFFTTVVLFIPAVISMFVFEADGDSISIRSLGWPLANTVVFGVLLSENFSDEKSVNSKDFQREFLVTFVCTMLLELFYFPELSLWGLLMCGLLIGIAVRELDPVYSTYLELGVESSESFTALIMKPIRHILSERKSRKIALFLLINMGYMVVEFVAGFMSNSLGLISDACHMLFDCAALGIGLYASYISRLPANSQFNYGRGRFEVLSGYVNAVFLVLVGALIVLESLERILDPQEISTNSLLTVSIGGLVVNVVGLIFFHEEHHHAHGGTGSCTHSHSHSPSHSHSHTHSHTDEHNHSHGHCGHDHKAHGNHHECIVVSHDSHEKSSSAHDDLHKEAHDHHNCNHNHGSDHTQNHKSSSASCHGHDHHNHVHDHDHHGNRHLGHGDEHHHVHDDDHHEHHHHEHIHEHPHGGASVNSSRSFNGHSTKDPSGGDSHVHSLGFEVHSSGLSGNSQQIELPSHREEKQKPHRHIDHNMEGIFLHVLADTMGSVGVVISTLLIKYKGWLVADPICSIFISVLIVASVISLLRNSAEVLLQRIPRAHEHDLREALNDIVKIKGVRGIQNFHVWSFTNTEVVGTLHLHVSTEADMANAKAQVLHMLHDAGIKDLTVQVECVKGS